MSEPMSGQCALVEKKCEQVLRFESQLGSILADPVCARKDHQSICRSLAEKAHPYIQSHRALWRDVAGVSTLSAGADERRTVMP
eukprot:2964580-Rhodomonas_salina.1